jgi:hypothetical protein
MDSLPASHEAAWRRRRRGGVGCDARMSPLLNKSGQNLEAEPPS